MKNILYTLLLSIIFLAPQGELLADSDNQHNKFKPEKYKKVKPKHDKFWRVPFATKADLELINQEIADINASLDALELVGVSPEELAAALAPLQAEIDALELQVGVSPDELAAALEPLQANIDANEENVTLALDGITEIRTIDIVGINEAIISINDRIDTLHSTDPSELVFSGFFTGDIEADANTQQDWVAFRSNATGPFTAIEISNTVGQSVKCDNPTNATLIAMALNSTNLTTNNNIPPLSLQCGTGVWWNVGLCGLPGNSSIELNAGLNRIVCQCITQDAVVRPRKGDSNWGGIGGVNCGAPDQVMEVILSR